MFGRNKQKKLDPRVRYQQSSFNRKLDERRTFKRKSTPVVERDPSSWNFLPVLGLKSRWAQALAILIFLGIVYLVYIPNFLFIKNVEVQGAGQDEANQLKASIDYYLNHAPVFLPRKN